MTTVRNVAREKLEAGQLSLGVGIRLTRSVEIAKAMATAGFDWPNGYYLVDAAGRLRSTLNEGATSPQIAAAVRTLQKESP